LSPPHLRTIKLKPQVHVALEQIFTQHAFLLHMKIDHDHLQDYLMVEHSSPPTKVLIHHLKIVLGTDSIVPYSKNNKIFKM